MKFAVSLVLNPDRPFTKGLVDLRDLLVGTLRELGHDARFLTNDFDPSAVNIVLGYHRLESLPDPGSFPIIVYQLEQLSEREGWFSDRLEALLRGADAVWDYSADNVSFLRDRGIEAVHVPYDRLVDTCLHYVTRADERTEWADRGHDAHRKRPMTTFLQQAIAATPGLP